MWKNLITRLALDGEVDPKLTIHHVGMVFMVPGEGEEPLRLAPGSGEEDGSGSNCTAQKDEKLPEFEVQERIRVDHSAQNTGFETTAVTNPDGSLMLVRIPKTPDNKDPTTLSNDQHVIQAISRADASVQEAIADDNAAVSSGAQMQADLSIVQAISRADEDWVERLRRSDEALQRRLQG